MRHRHDAMLENRCLIRRVRAEVLLKVQYKKTLCKKINQRMSSSWPQIKTEILNQDVLPCVTKVTVFMLWFKEMCLALFSWICSLKCHLMSSMAFKTWWIIIFEMHLLISNAAYIILLFIHFISETFNSGSSMTKLTIATVELLLSWSSCIGLAVCT